MLIACDKALSQHKISSLKIRSVPIDILTPYRVNCDFFETAFDGQYSQKIIKEKRDLNQMLSLIKKVIYETSDREVDTRVKIYISFENSIKQTIICVSPNELITVNGKLIKKNKPLIEFILKCLLKSEG